MVSFFFTGSYAAKKIYFNPVSMKDQCVFLRGSMKHVCIWLEFCIMKSAGNFDFLSANKSGYILFPIRYE